MGGTNARVLFAPPERGRYHIVATTSDSKFGAFVLSARVPEGAGGKSFAARDLPAGRPRC